MSEIFMYELLAISRCFSSLPCGLCSSRMIIHIIDSLPVFSVCGICLIYLILLSLIILCSPLFYLSKTFGICLYAILQVTYKCATHVQLCVCKKFKCWDRTWEDSDFKSSLTSTFRIYSFLELKTKPLLLFFARTWIYRNF